MMEVAYGQPIKSCADLEKGQPHEALNVKVHALESDYENAFKIACALLNGDTLYGIDSNTIFSETMKKDGCICSVDYENYILTHLDRLMYGEELDG